MTIFNKKAADRLRTPDDLEKYLKVTSPSAWMIVVAGLSLLLGLFAWSVFGTVSSGVSSVATLVDGQVVCLLSGKDSASVQVGDDATVAGERMHIKDVAVVPYSREEAKELLGSDYLVSVLMDGDWGYLVVFETQEQVSLASGVPLAAQITTERVSPFSLVFGRGLDEQ